MNKYPQLMGILKYLMGDFQGAKGLLFPEPQQDPVPQAKKKTAAIHETQQDRVTTWYKALTLLSSDKESTEKNAPVIALIDFTFSNPLNKFKTIMECLYLNDTVKEFVTQTARQTNSSHNDKSRLLCLNLLLNNREGKNIEAELKKDHDQGNADATLLLVQIYHDGFVGQSFENALSMLQESVQQDKEFRKDRSQLLITMTADATESKDYVSMMHAHYLNGLENCKFGSNQVNLQALLKSAEIRLEDINKDETLKHELRIAIADLLCKTGAYDAFLASAEKNEDIAFALCNVILKANQLEGQKRPDQKYAKAFELVRPLKEKQIKYIEALSLIYNLLKFYNGERLIERINEESPYWLAPEDVYKGTFEICRDLVAKPARSFSEFMGILYYLQGNFKQADEAMKTWPEEKKAYGYWYRALIKLYAELTSAERDTLIIQYLAKALEMHLEDYQTLKKLCIFDAGLVTFLKDKMGADRKVAPLLARMAVLFGCEAIGIDVDTAINYLQVEHESDKGGPSSYFLAELYINGTFVPRSLLKALAIAQAIMDAGRHHSIASLLYQISDQINDQSDLDLQIHMACLFIIEMEQAPNEEAVLAEIMQLATRCKELSSPTHHGPQEIILLANLLKSTGAYKSMLAIGQKNPEIGAKVQEM